MVLRRSIICIISLTIHLTTIIILVITVYPISITKIASLLVRTIMIQHWLSIVWLLLHIVKIRRLGRRT